MVKFFMGKMSQPLPGKTREIEHSLCLRAGQTQTTGQVEGRPGPAPTA